MKTLTMYDCDICGNRVVMVEDSGMIPVCCGRKMQLLEENTNDGVVEKHLPRFTKEGALVHVEVGETLHPMMESHHIEWVVLLTTRGLYARWLPINAAPVTDFAIRPDEEILSVYAMCNLHGLWCAKSTGEVGETE